MRMQHDILAALAVSARSYLEVGVQEGKSLSAVLRANPHLSVTLCDTWGDVSGGSNRGSHAHILPLVEGVTVTFLDGDSREVLPRLMGPYNLVHIDGGHSFDVAESDLREGWRLCDGVMVVHDLAFYDVWRAFFAFVQASTPSRVECHFGGNGTGVVYR